MEEKDFFDATKEEQKNNEQLEKDLLEMRAKAEINRRVNLELSDKEILRQKKKKFRTYCILSIVSVAIMLILAIVFFIFLKIYGAGIGFAILGIVLSQVWLSFFKKWNNNNSPILYEEEQEENKIYENDNK